jgi:eukaryotic-like serine/threonine-protein kinase
MPETVGRYEILEKIGQGGMGTVYKAFDPLLRRTVAVKLISAVLDDKPEMRERFFREARAAGQLSHKNIIVIYDLGEEKGQPFLAMEYLSGAALAARMTGAGRLPVARAVNVMIDVCHALEYAHARGVVHRDITPANIFITDADEVKLLDFGLAHLVSSELTRSETVMGTANYMSPEQVRGERVDRRADIFAVGVVLYEVLAGRKAFEGDSFANTLFKVLEGVPPPLQTLDPTLPGPVVGVVDRALAKRREERYQTAAEMLHDLTVCRQWILDPLRPASILSMAPTVATMRPATGTKDPVVATPPQSVVWSPRRVRTTAIVGFVLAGTGALLLFGPREASRSSLPAPERDPAAETQPAQTQPAPPPPVAPPITAAREPEPTRQTAPSTPAVPQVQRTTDAAAGSQADRGRADAAIARARQARALAEKSGAEGLAAYRNAISTEGEAAGLYAAGQYARAAARAVEAEAMYRGADIEAHAEQIARERLRLDANQAPAAAIEPPRAAEPPRLEPPEPAQPEPAPPTPDPRELVGMVLSQYVAALEARSIGGLKAVWPSLPPAQEQAIRGEFANARTLQVRLREPRIDVNGAAATVTAMREYQLVTADGHRLATTTRMIMKLRRTGEIWVIDSVSYQ